MPLWDKIMLRKRYIIECINELLKNKANLVHSRHRSIHNFIMNLCSALTAYCFFENKPETLPMYVEKKGSWNFFHAKLIPNSSINSCENSKCLRNKVLKTLGYVRIFTYLGAANITSKQKSDMTKVAIKNENITSFGGNYPNRRAALQYVLYTCSQLRQPM